MLNVCILSPEKIIVKTQASQVTLPSYDGYITILPRHTSLISRLGFGQVIIDMGVGLQKKIFISGGYLDIHRDILKILADVSEVSTSIILSRALESKKRAEMRLSQKKVELDILRAQKSLTRALYRLDIAKK